MPRPATEVSRSGASLSQKENPRSDIANAIMNGEIIEDYPLEAGNVAVASFPSCLILGIGSTKADAIHVVVGYNGKKIIIISAYRPDEEHWEPDFKTRKGR